LESRKGLERFGNVARGADEQKSGDHSVASFADLLDFHLKNGTRPKGSPDVLGKEWTNREFAEALGETGDRTVRNWRRGRTTPPESTPIEQALFGQNPLYAASRAELRDAHRKAEPLTLLTEPVPNRFDTESPLCALKCLGVGDVLTLT
jgi:hypothetical protein